MLEDRYAYEGFNRFIFFVFWLLVSYQVVVSRSYNAWKTALLKQKVIPTDDNGDTSFVQLERKEFATWSLKKVQDILREPDDYFGDEYSLLRIGFEIEPALCNHTKYHPIYKTASHLNEYVRINTCPTISSMETGKGISRTIVMLKNKFDLYGVLNYKKPAA
eukprot:g15539.t1